MGFDDPLIVQYGRFLKGALRGDFGLSFRHNQPALQLVWDRMPATVQLTLAAMLISVSIAVPIGILSAVKRNSLLDHVGMVIALLGQSMPVFWLGIMLILIFGVKLRLLPSFGMGGIDHLILPALTLGMFTMARTARLTRSEMLEILGQEYIRTARAKGVPPWSVILRHALKNAAIPIVTVIGLEMGTLLGGAIITETIFAWPGVGRLTVQAIYNRDFPVVQAAVFTLACIFVLINFVVDILYTYLDPRVRYE
jgi:peptide/nickel transport system permease protein